MDRVMPYTTHNENLAKSLEKYDSRRRITWLRSRTIAYTQDLAARHYLKIPCFIEGEPVTDVHSEALQAVINVGSEAKLTPDEMRMAFLANWEGGIELGKKVLARCERIAAQQIQLYRTRKTIRDALINDTRNWPIEWPYLSATDLLLIAIRFE